MEKNNNKTNFPILITMNMRLKIAKISPKATKKGNDYDLLQ